MLRDLGIKSGASERVVSIWMHVLCVYLSVFRIDVIDYVDCVELILYTQEEMPAPLVGL